MLIYQTIVQPQKQGIFDKAFACSVDDLIFLVHILTIRCFEIHSENMLMRSSLRRVDKVHNAPLI